MGYDDVTATRTAFRGALHLEALSRSSLARRDCSGFVLGYASRGAEQVGAAVEQFSGLLAHVS